MATFDELVKLEPQLSSLMEEAKAHRRSKAKEFCANLVWYGYPGSAFEGRGLKERVVELVGKHASENPVLATEDARSVAYQAIYRALPDCRHEGICSGGLMRPEDPPEVKKLNALADGAKQGIKEWLDNNAVELFDHLAKKIAADVAQELKRH